jgi:hypothetical protein
MEADCESTGGRDDISFINGIWCRLREGFMIILTL